MMMQVIIKNASTVDKKSFVDNINCVQLYFSVTLNLEIITEK